MEQLKFFSIEKKIQNAITLLKMFEAKAIEMHPEGYYLCFSGGKDSQVIYELAKQAKVSFRFIIMYNRRFPRNWSIYPKNVSCGYYQSA